MRSYEAINNEIKYLLEEATDKVTKRERTKIGNRVVFLKMCLLYLESGATEEFVRKEYDRLHNKVRLIDEGYDYFKLFCAAEDPRHEYELETGLPRLKEQLKTIEFLLN